MLFFIGVISTMTVGGLHAQSLYPTKPTLDFIKKGSILTVKTAAGENLGTVDLDKPAFKGKVVAFTYSARKKAEVGNSVNAMTIFPNPASKQVNLQFKGSWKYPVDVQLFDKAGNALQSAKLKSAEQPLDIGSLTQGVYILKAESGNAKATEKLIVQ